MIYHLEEFFEVYFSAAILVKCAEYVLVECAGFSVRKQCLVDIEEFTTGELTIGTVFLQQNRQQKAVMCLSIYSESIFEIKLKQVYNFLVTTAAQQTLCFPKFKYITIFVV